MKHSTYLSSNRSSSYFLAILLLLITTLFCSKTYAQTKIYANSASYVSPVSGIATGFTPTVLNATNAVTSTSLTDFATIKSYGGVAVGVGNYSGELEMKFPSSIPAGTTSYIRIDFDSDVLNSLLGGNLGGVLADLAGNLVLGDHTFEVGARNSTSQNPPILRGTSASAFNTTNLRLIKDVNGFFYIAITPNASYDRVYIKDRTAALLLSTANTTNVYYAYYNSGTDACAQAFATSFDGTGLTTDVLGLGGAGVTNSQYAIDNDPATFSQMSLGALGVAGSISQNFYFSTLSAGTDEFNLKLATSTALLNAQVLNNITVTAYNGDTEVSSQPLSSLIGLDLLGLLSPGDVIPIGFSPGAPFNRVTVTLSSLLNVNLTQTIQIYGITRSAGKPTFTLPASSAVNTCYNSTATLTATTANTNELLWYADLTGVTPLQTVAFNAGFTTPALIANKTYYVSARRIGCIAESIRVPVTVTVNPQIVFTGGTVPTPTVGFIYTKQLTSATGGTPGFTYALAPASTLPAGLTLSTSGIITGTPTAVGSSTFSVIATDSKGCTSTAVFSTTVAPALTLAPAALPNGITGIVYPTQTIPAAAGGTGPYTYVAPTLPPGLAFNVTTREITGTPTQAGNYTIPVTVTDANGNTITSNYTVKITDPLVLPAATLANGTTGVVYTTQIIPIATGGTLPYTYTATGLPPGLAFNPTTREITGTPTTVGTFSVPVTVTDADGKTVTTNYSIAVASPLLLPSATLPTGTENVAYPTQTLPSATGGVGPYTYVGRDLPPGLSFDPATRTITGTPTQAGTSAVGVIVTDSQGNKATNTYAININGVLSLPTKVLANGIVGTSYPTETLPVVTGGTVPYTYLVSNLPPGLNFNTTTREITGTPTVGGTFVLNLTATDAAGNKVNTNYAIVVTVNQPVVAAATVCSGSSATLSVSNLQSGVTYNWYASTGSTALATNNSGVFVTPTVNSQTVFYVEAVSGTAISPRTAVTASINPTANLAVVTTNNQIINVGQTATLSATADGDNTIAWFDAATGGLQVGTGNTFTTAALNTTTTYYVETRTAIGCANPIRVPITVTVINGGGGSACNAANTQRSGISGVLCVLCAISDPENSTDANPNNYTRITLSVGVAASGYQQLIFPTLGSATDSIRLDLATPTGLLDLSVLGGVTVNVFNGTTLVRSMQLNSALLNLQLLNGNRFKATLAAGSVYDRVEVRINGLASALTSLDVYGATVIYPNPTVTSGSQTICANSTATLNATASGGTSLAWYATETGGTPLSNGATYTTPALATTTTYYIEVSKGTCANVDRVPVIVSVTPALTTPVLVPNANACEGSTVTLSVANADPAITYRWYDAATAGNLVFTGTVFVTPALTVNTNYYVEAEQGNCTSGARGVSAVTVNPRPALPTVSASASTVSAGQTAILTASSTDPTVTFNWYTSPNGTTAVYSGPTYVTPPLTATTTYYVESVSTTGCTSTARVQITITVDTTTPPSTVPCEGAITQTNGVTGVALFSGVSNAGLAIDNDTQTASSLVMPVGVSGASVYQYVGFETLSKVGDTVSILVSSPGKLLSLALLGDAQITTFNGTTSNGNSKFLNDNLLTVELLSGSTQALISFVPTSSFNGVELRLNSGVLGALTSINFNYARRSLSAPVLVANTVNICADNTATISVSNPVLGATYQWFDSSGTYQAGKDGISFTTPVLNASTTYSVVTEGSTGCLSPKAIAQVTVNPTPSTPELLSPTVSTCVGQTVILQLKNPVTGTVYKWYNASNTYQAGLDGTSFTIANIAAGTTTYSVEASSTCGTSSARATATINTTGLDSPIITSPSPVVISPGSSALLSAVSATSGAQIDWYAAATGGASLGTGNNFVTQTLTADQSFWAEATVSGGGCAPAARTRVDVQVIPNGGPTPPPCGYATTSTDGVSGITIGGVINPGNAVDGDINTGSSLIVPVGILNGFVYQRVGFGSLSTPGDTIRIKISSPAKLLSLAVLPSLVVTTYNNTSSNNDATAVISSFIKLDLLSDGSSAIITFVPTSTFDGVELRLNSGLASLLSSVNFDYAQRAVPVPKLLSASASACEGSATTLQVANPQAGLTYKWYQNGTYLAGQDGAVLTTRLTPTPLPSGVYTFTVTATGNNGCETKPATATVTIFALPAPPVAAVGNPVSICINTPVTLAVQAVANVQFNWYTAATGGNLLVNNRATFTTAANLVAGTYDYYVEAVNTGGSSCSSSTRTKISILIKPASTANDISVAGNTIVCAPGKAVLTASSTTVTNPAFIWYSDASLTTVAGLGATFTTPLLSADTKYYVSVSGSDKCANAAGTGKEVSVTINPVAVASDISLSGTSTTCGNSAVVLMASSTTVTNPVFTWYSDAGLTTAAWTGATFNTPTLTATTTYYVTVRGDNKCENTAATAKPLTITVKPTATDADLSVSGLTTICKGSSTVLHAATTTVTNPVFTWYNDTSLSTVVRVGSTFSTVALTANTTYYVTIKGDNKCENLPGFAQQVDITVKNYATAADITLNNAKVCAGSSAVLMASSLTVTQPVFTWYSDASLTVPVFTGPTFTVPLTTTTTYYVTVKGTNKCENAAADAKAVTVTVNPLATTTDIIATSGPTICPNSSVVLVASSPTVINPMFIWYSDAALTNIAYIGTPFTTPALLVSTTYYVTVKGDNKCENAPGTAKVISITVKPIATAADITASDAQVCSGSGTTLVASTTTITNPVFTWYSNAALTTVLAVGASLPTGNLTVTTKYYVTVRGDEKCENSSATAKIVTVSVNPLAIAADIVLSTPTRVCGSGTSTINASSTTVTSPVFTWYSDASLTAVAFSGSTFVTPNLTATTTFWVTVKGANKCENNAANAKAITVVVTPNAVAADIATSGATTICANTTTILTASSTTVTNPVFTWYSDAALTSVANVGASFTTPILTGNTSYYVTVKGDNKCENLPGTGRVVTIIVNTLPTNPIIPTAGLNICAGDAAILALQNPQNGITYEWYDAAIGGNLVYTGTTFNTPALNATKDYYVLAINASGCNNGNGRVLVRVTVNPKPVIPTVVSPNIAVCTGNVAVLEILNPQNGVVYNWYTLPTGGSLIGTGVTITSPTVSTNVTYYAEAVSGFCVSTARTAVNVVPSPLPTAPTSLSVANSPICSGSTTILSVNNPVAGQKYRWFTTSSGGVALAEGITYTTAALTNTTIYYVESVSTTGCVSLTRTAITVNVLPVLAAPVISVQSTTSNSVIFAWPAVVGATAYEVSTDNGVTWQAPTNGPSGTTFVVLGLKPDQSVTLTVRAKGQIDCQTSANSIGVVGKAANPLGNEIFIPNAFTPNNDGKNDVFLVFGNTITSGIMNVYTQWGQLIYQSNNIANGWDGTYQGSNQPSGVYVYTIEVVFTDGTSVIKKGTVTLIR